MTVDAIRTHQLSRSFGRIRAVQDLSLAVPEGSVFGFLGPNGAGKTTTIQMLLGILEPSSGRAEVLGYDCAHQGDDVRMRVGALLEHPGIYEQMSAEDNLEFYARVWRLTPGDRRSRIKELLDRMGLWERRKERAGDWSRGMKQKLALARVLLHRPRLVLLDEPTAGLDVVAAVTVRDDLAALAAEEGTTIFLTTHNMAEAERLCHQVAVIRAGRLIAMGHPDELRARLSAPQIEIIGRSFHPDAVAQLRAQPCVVSAEVQNGRLLVGLRDNADSASVISLLVNSGAQIEEVRRSKATLEEVFITLMEETQ